MSATKQIAIKTKAGEDEMMQFFSSGTNGFQTQGVSIPITLRDLHREPAGSKPNLETLHSSEADMNVDGDRQDRPTEMHTNLLLKVCKHTHTQTEIDQPQPFSPSLVLHTCHTTMAMPGHPQRSYHW